MLRAVFRNKQSEVCCCLLDVSSTKIKPREAHRRKIDGAMARLAAAMRQSVAQSGSERGLKRP